jgi:AraC family transcriptional regulator
MYGLVKEEYLGNTKRSYSNSQGISVVETEYKQKVFEGWHSHENAHITLFMKGGTLEKRKNTYHTISPEKLLFYHSDELHLNYETQFPSNNINIEIEPEILIEYSFTESMFEQAVHDNAKVKFLILKMYKECLMKDHFTNDAISMLFTQLSGQLERKERALHFPRWIKQLHELLNDCWDENPCLHDLAGELNVNHITISKYFPKYFGCTLGEYMRRLKIDHSIGLIREHGQSLTEVALQCGFADQSHFIRIFKDQTGFLPKQFQKM